MEIRNEQLQRNNNENAMEEMKHAMKMNDKINDNAIKNAAITQMDRHTNENMKWDIKWRQMQWKTKSIKQINEQRQNINQTKQTSSAIETNEWTNTMVKWTTNSMNIIQWKHAMKQKWQRQWHKSNHKNAMKQRSMKSQWQKCEEQMHW